MELYRFYLISGCFFFVVGFEETPFIFVSLDQIEHSSAHDVCTMNDQS